MGKRGSKPQGANGQNVAIMIQYELRQPFEIRGRFAIRDVGVRPAVSV